MIAVHKPQTGEYAPYAIDYIRHVPDDGRVLIHMETGLQTMRDLISVIPASRLTTPFANGEWTVQEILVHIIDSERVFAYRALRIGRGDTTELAGFDQGTYVASCAANARTLDSILAEYAAVRVATLALFQSFDEAAFLRLGAANKNPLSVRATAYIIAGHELHHLDSIRTNYAGRLA